MMSDYEPGAGVNLPAGCFDVPDTSMGDTCGECRHAVQFGDSHIVCGIEFLNLLPTAEDSAREILELAAGCMIPDTSEACRDFEAG